MKLRAVLLLVLCMFGVGTVAAEEPGIPRFYVDYAVVQNTLMGDKGLFDELITLNKLDAKASENLAEFWQAQALTHCDPIFDNAIKHKRVETEEQMKKVRSSFFRGYYFDRWETINRTIAATLAMVKQNSAAMP